MATDTLPGLGSAATTPISAGAAITANSSPDTVNFRRLLESLEKLTKDHQQAPPAAAVGDADQLQAAMQRVDEGFTTAMDLRRQLEAAFRSRLS
ncbi:MAG: hypothetical protein IT456_00890 [Planctomycetes bacterium]|jgi:aspartate aminotransferase-like enzyme|nr:hypothetical protein [Planctomycetota bacterium]